MIGPRVGRAVIGVGRGTLYREREFDVRDEPISLSPIRMDEGYSTGDGGRCIFIGRETKPWVELTAGKWLLSASANLRWTPSAPHTRVQGRRGPGVGRRRRRGARDPPRRVPQGALGARR